ncbi:hypothetical protein A6V39_03790 [Candidatus Mycoplasma haematobovis]|uniref:Uncharacterized protein n=1 Tax=Candidatus Mycoplasma haematobovis TaxID=432608 RepID=A0A1A9QE79_9MOLU|nr:hypothetical protein [Candidatus Mycoplasma haematobovis]OAL10009.1 hypothetical protein A6V39_03790 [Candidatus Mycoplasma haematobovis]
MEAWKKYVSTHSTSDMANTEDSWGLNEWSKISEDKIKVPDALVEECGKKINEKIDNKDNPIFKNFVNWCTVEKTT